MKFAYKNQVMRFQRYLRMTLFMTGSKLVHNAKLKSYYSAEQANIFAETAYPVCENVITGYNGTIFAYG